MTIIILYLLITFYISGFGPSKLEHYVISSLTHFVPALMIRWLRLREAKQFTQIDPTNK